jgi:hypothetical protein
MNQISEIRFVFYFFSFEIGNKQAAFAAVHFVVGLGVGIEQIAELLRGQTLEVFKNLQGFETGYGFAGVFLFPYGL